MYTYSFLDVSATIAGPTGVATIGQGSANAKEEGISVEYANPRNAMTVGADGEGMHTLKADKSGTVTIRLLYTSPVNATLMAMANAQFLSSSAHGNNVITIRNKGNEDVIVCRNVAFTNIPNRSFGEDVGLMEWVFHALKIDNLTGTY